MINTLSASENAFLRAIEKIQARGERAQMQVTSGKRIFSASDEPDGVSALLTTRAEIESNDQLKNNLGRTKAEVDAAENGLQQAIKILERARTLAAQAQNGFNVDSTWKALSLEAGDLTQQMLNVSNLAIEGRYVFAGNADNRQPFDFDPGLNAVTSYNGGLATRQSLFPGGNPFDIARPGDVIFDNQTYDDDGVSRSTFAALQTLRNALESKDEAGLRDALRSIETSAKNIAGELSFYGATQRRVVEATSATETTSLRLRSQLERLEGADMTESILESQQAAFQLNAAYQIRGARKNQSLFDYLG